MRDELILALELYLQHRASPPGKDSPEVAELSSLLNDMGCALGLDEPDTYRNPNGVYMKMMNFRRFDPEYTKEGKVGLTRGNKDEKKVWNEFASDSERLAIVCSAIKLAIQRYSADAELSGADDPAIAEAEEGRILTRLHRVRERSRKLVEQAKTAALKKHGRLFCEACGFDFREKYGPIGEGLIDVHHTKPVHTLTEGDTTKLEDLALLCSNCHRVVHSSRRWLSVEQVSDLVRRVFRDIRASPLHPSGKL
ncbi:HNH endonuclease [Trinickia violacea]|uniref:HNH endonuclease n=2 Tax=Trinickia violacea TaxID=2571746 RepID=A0A4P8IUU8_9BURK|nr:HNH endonuclease [Trinickia violacea]